jgi:N-methylhydantoinase A/oxoprolinase/acetone carboxylase beta subunit
MPEVVSIGLGGGSKVYVDPQSETVTIGPASVGHDILQEAKVFGDQTLTSSDIVVALGKAHLGDAALVKDILSPDLLESARKQLKRMLEGIIEQMKASDAPVHVLLVGGGALLVTENLDGVDKCIQPIHQGASNAVGAAIAKISGEVDVVEIPGGRSENEFIESVCEKAVGLAVQRSASREDVQIVEVNKMPLQYMPNGGIRIQIREIGPLATPTEFTPPSSPPLFCEDDFEVEEGEQFGVPSALDPTYKPALHVDLNAYRPQV